MIGKNLKYYRLMASLSQAELANKIGVSKMAISNYEKDKREADSDMIIKIADALNIKAINLLKLVDNKAIITHEKFRKKSCANLSDIEMLYETLDRRLRNLNDIISIVGNSYIVNNPVIKKIKHKNIDESAKILRTYLCLPEKGPIGNITDILENKGFLVCFIDVKSDWFSGINGLVNDRPYIGLRENMSAERQRFTIIHELIHILFSFEKEDEKIVDEIAGAFFFPKEDAYRKLGKSRTNIISDLRPLQREYGISMQCILIRAKQLSIITYKSYESHQKWLSQQGLRKDEKSNLQKEYSCLLERLVNQALVEDLISINKASELLDVSSTIIQKKYDRESLSCL